jgi:hypothetical protein
MARIRAAAQRSLAAAGRKRIATTMLAKALTSCCDCNSRNILSDCPFPTIVMPQRADVLFQALCVFCIFIS